MTLKEIYNVCVPPAKAKTDKLIPWLYYVVRPLSILITKPLLKTKITPVQVTFISMIATLVGFGFVGFGQDLMARLIGWFGFFIWALLDCVDGNIARCKGLASDRGALWDATGGYMALSLLFFSAGIGAFNDNSFFEFLPKYLYLIFGGMAALMSLFPRLVMQKKKTSEQGSEAVKSVGDKSSFSLPKIIALNIESAIGFMQVVLLLSIIFHFLNLFVLAYFIINMVIMLFSLYTLLN